MSTEWKCDNFFYCLLSQHVQCRVYLVQIYSLEILICAWNPRYLLFDRQSCAPRVHHTSYDLNHEQNVQTSVLVMASTSQVFQPSILSISFPSLVTRMKKKSFTIYEKVSNLQISVWKSLIKSEQIKIKLNHHQSNGNYVTIFFSRFFLSESRFL